MTTFHFIQSLEKQDCRFAVNPDGRLKTNTPSGVLTEETRRVIRENKEKILFLLSGGRGGTRIPFPDWLKEDGTCYICRKLKPWLAKATGNIICGICHPPPVPELAEWVEPERLIITGQKGG